MPENIPADKSMTFEEFLKKTLAVFPNAVVQEDPFGSIVIYPGYFENPTTKRMEPVEDNG